MTTQVRPVSGGTWNNANLDAGKSALKTTNFGFTLPEQHWGNVLNAVNEWVNCGGAGTAGADAQKRAAAIGVQLQEV